MSYYGGRLIIAVRGHTPYLCLSPKGAYKANQVPVRRAIGMGVSFRAA